MNELLATFLSGSLFSALIAAFTFRAKVRKAEAESKAADLANTEQATQILLTNIVEPLKNELYDIRLQLKATEKEIIRLREAINCANHCEYSTNCPVILRLQNVKNAKGGNEGNLRNVDSDTKSQEFS